MIMWRAQIDRKAKLVMAKKNPDAVKVRTTGVRVLLGGTNFAPPPPRAGRH